MKKSLLSGLAVLATTAFLTATAPSASADTTNVTFSLAGGLLSVSAPPTAALPNGNSGASEISGPLGDTVLTDNRGETLVSWSVGASTSTFGNGTTTATEVSYNSGLVGFTGTSVPLSNGDVTLSETPAEVVGADGIVGNNTATWNPTLTVTLPSSSTTGDYAGTITTSLL